MEQAERHNVSYYRYLNRRILANYISVALIPLLLTSVVTFLFFMSAYQDKVLAHLMVLTKKHQQNIDGFLLERSANIQELANSYSLEQLSDEKFLQNSLFSLQKFYSNTFVDLGIVREDGKQFAYVGPYDLKNANYGNASWFREAISRPFFISDVFTGLRGSPHFIVTARGVGRGSKWILRATVNFDKFNSLVENISMGKTGFAFILNRNGEFQTRPRSEVDPSRKPYSDFLEKLKSEGAKSQAAGDAFAGRGSRSTIYVMSVLKNGEWLLVFQQSRTDAFSDLNTANIIISLLLFTGSVVIVITARILARRIVARVRQVDLEKAMMKEQIIEAGKLASLGELAAGIAHEINNPIAVMVEEAGWIQDLLDEEEPGASKNMAEFQRALSQIKTQGLRCKQITHKLLSFARKTDPTTKEIVMNDLVEETMELCQQRIVYGNVKIEYHLGKNLPIVEAPPQELQQVIINLVNNALDALETRGGTVTITTRKEDGFVVLDVADDGPGIPSSILSRIFDPFFTTKTVGKGTGLGLSICYGIVEKIGGNISLSTAEGVGTTFHVKLPVKAAKEAAGP